MRTIGDTTIQRMPQDAVHSVTAVGQAPQTARLDSDHGAVSFGSSATLCDLALTSNDPAVRIPARAGVLWRQGSVVWLRNLSIAYELTLLPAGGARRTLARGSTTFLPGPSCRVVGPDGVDLLVELEPQ